MNAMTLAELIVIDPYFADCVLRAARGSSMYCVKGESEKLCLEEVFE